ncbi:hypothetical protein GCM10022291_34500 [Postechiella marina]|uniref:DUF4129 domain-containing protein n=1 Tax=Postechiella marina TaxID=943941 RepID=A0ABP8CI33_9FLAO
MTFTSQTFTYALTVNDNLDKIRQFDEDFKSRYSSRKYNYEGEKIIGKTEVGKGEYADYKNEKVKQKEKNNQDDLSINFGPFAWLFYMALAAAVFYLVYILFNEGGSGLFTSSRNKKVNNFDEITAENIEQADIHTLIKNAENEQDYRLAVRYHYLLTLKTLSLKNYIKFEDDKTNAEYLDEVSNKPFGSKFAYAQYLYNYVWYGKFPVNINQYTKAKSNFTTLLNLLK